MCTANTVHPNAMVRLGSQTYRSKELMVRDSGQGPLRLAVRRLTGADPSQKKEVWSAILTWCGYCGGSAGNAEVGPVSVACGAFSSDSPLRMEGRASSQAAIWRYTRRGMEAMNTGLMKNEIKNQQVDISPTTPLSSPTTIHLTFHPSLSYTMPPGIPIFPLSRRRSCVKLSSVVVLEPA